MENRERLKLVLTDPRQALFRAMRCDFLNNCEDFVRHFLWPPADVIVNANELRVLGMQRSGHHAIMEWIIKSYDGKFLFLNNAPVGQNAYRNRVQYPVPPVSSSFDSQMRRARRGRFENLDLLVLSYEDSDPTEVFHDLHNPKHDLYYGKTGQFWNIMIIRDPFNMLASRIKSGYTVTRSKLGQIDLWIEHAKYAVASEKKNDFLLIKYNDWVASREYRFQLQEKLGLKRRDISIEKVSSFGGGSSFDGTRMDGQASSMAVFDRWKELKNNPEFSEILCNEKLNYYHNLLFGERDRPPQGKD